MQSSLHAATGTCNIVSIHLIIRLVRVQVDHGIVVLPIIKIRMQYTISIRNMISVYKYHYTDIYIWTYIYIYMNM